MILLICFVVVSQIALVDCAGKAEFIRPDRLNRSNEFDPTGGLVVFRRAEFIRPRRLGPVVFRRAEFFRPQGIGRTVDLVERIRPYGGSIQIQSQCG